MAPEGGDLRGRVLEIGDDRYSRAFRRTPRGARARSAISKLDILDVDETNPNATIIADLTHGRGIPSNTFDCVICTQTLHLIYGLREAIATLHRILRPGGVVLATFPGISKICSHESSPWGDHWRLTSQSARRLFEDTFQGEELTIEAFGNVLSSSCFLYGLAADDLTETQLDFRDPDYELVIAVRAVKGSTAATAS